MRLSRAAVLLAMLASGHVLGVFAQGPTLTTKDQASGPTLLVDENGNEVTIKGIGWYGFNTGFTAPEGLRQGTTDETMDIGQVIYRMKMLGFNAIRLPMTFDNHWGLGQTPPVNYTVPCDTATTAQIQQGLTPPTFPKLALAKSPALPQTPPAVPGYCNADMPNDSTLNRYVWTVAQFVNEGFYVNVDYHSNNYTNMIAGGDGSIFDKPTWTQTWVYLLETIVKSVPQAQGRLLIDLINEPDGFGLTWSVPAGSAVASLTDYYIDTINALYPVCPTCIFLVEGGGQADYCSTNWGNGFATSSAVTQLPGVSDATPFFEAVLNQPWLSQVVLAPHFYCPGVSGETRAQCYAGAGQWQGFDNTVGYLTVAPGYCSNNGTCKVFNALVDEFGSTLNSTVEDSCMASILSYMNVAPGTGKHAPFNNWFYWAWQPDSLGTGGMVEDDWTTVRWDKVASLTGATKNWTTGAGMQPWYLASFNSTAPTNELDPVNPPFSVVAVTNSPPTPVAAAVNATSEAAAVPATAPATATWAAATEASPSHNGVPAGAAAAGAVLLATLIALVCLILV